MDFNVQATSRQPAAVKQFLTVSFFCCLWVVRGAGSVIRDKSLLTVGSQTLRYHKSSVPISRKVSNHTKLKLCDKIAKLTVVNENINSINVLYQMEVKNLYFHSKKISSFLFLLLISWERYLYESFSSNCKS